MKWAKAQCLDDEAILIVSKEKEGELVDARLGGNVFKKRIGISGRGKRGGLRTLLIYRANERLFFVGGFAKNERVNISQGELVALKKLAKELLGYSDSELEKSR